MFKHTGDPDWDHVLDEADDAGHLLVETELKRVDDTVDYGKIHDVFEMSPHLRNELPEHR